MKLIRLLSNLIPAAAFIGYVLWAYAAFAATPRTDSVISGDMITLGDLFDDAGPVAERTVMAAPAAGRSVVFDSPTLARIATANGIAWRPATGNEYAKVERASQRFDGTMIADGISRTLNLQAPSVGQTSIQLDNPQLVLDAPLNMPAQLGFASLQLDPTGQRFAGIAQIKVGDRIVAQASVAGRVVTMVDVPVLTRPMRRDEVITATDIAWQSTDLAAGNSNLIFNAEDIIGKAPRSGLRPGVPLHVVDLVTMPAVTRGKQVTMLYQVGMLTITAQGRALADAAVGDTVKVVNLASSRTLEGIVESDGVVRFGPAAIRQSADLVSAPSNVTTN